MVSRRQLLAGSLSAAAIGTLMPAAEIAAAPAQPAGQPITVRTKDGLTLSAMSYGAASAPPIIFVHGLSQSRLSCGHARCRERGGARLCATHAGAP